MNNFYKVTFRKKYKNISKQDRNNDIEDCKRMSNALIELTKDPKFAEQGLYTQHKQISEIIIDDNSNSLVFGEKEYSNNRNQTKTPEWVAQYRTNYSICKAYAYPGGKGFTCNDRLYLIQIINGRDGSDISMNFRFAEIFIN